MAVNDKLDAWLRQLQREGRLTTAVVIEEARDPACPAHGEFEWDVTKAAYATWKQTARRLIRRVEYVYHTEVTPAALVRVKTFVHDPRLSEGYVNITHVQAYEPELQAPILVEEFRRALNALRRAQGYATVFGFAGDVDDIIARVEQLIEQAESLSAVRP